jgi:threonine dehydratase
MKKEFLMDLLPLPTLDHIRQARIRLASVVLPTPLLPLNPAPVGAEDRFIKCENLQRTGSFKIRGAYNRIAQLSTAQRAAGVIAYSSGNHAQGVACAAALLGVQATIVMPENAIAAKVIATKSYGSTVLFAGTDSETRRRVAEDLARERGLELVPPYDCPAIIAGQGTLGLEVLEAVPHLESILVPIGGGGLISGVALAVKALRPQVRVIGVEPAGAADAQASRRIGQVVEWDSVETIADGLRAHRIGRLPFQVITTAVDDIVTVTDEAILAAVRWLLHAHRLVVEPSGAVAVAALQAGHGSGRSVAIVSGGNIDRALLAEMAASPMPES